MVDALAVTGACRQLEEGWDLLRTGRLGEALAAAERALGVLERELGGASADVANVLLLRAEVLGQLGRGGEGLRDLLRAVAITRPLRAMTPCDRVHAQALRGVAAGLWQAGRYRAAEAWLRHGLRFTAPLGEPMEMARLLNLLGMVLRYTGRLKAGERRLRMALRMVRSAAAGAAGQGAEATIRHNLAGLYLASGDLEAAEYQARAALELREEVDGGNVLAVAADRLCLAGVLSARGESTSARVLARAALAEYRMRLGEEHWEIGFCLHVLAHTHATEGHHRQAAELYRRAIAVKARALGENHPEVATSWLGLAQQLAGPEREYALRRAGQLTAAFHRRHPVRVRLHDLDRHPAPV
ncbi:tetratricopeptide repeat protein [Streptomyces sp. CA-251387]|uniref:tetratricopeptide repeat protein n=1 Tax=Streptomyces sp. CA-251387 TaxID=3240064 RepID=UPI003D8FEAD6